MKAILVVDMPETCSKCELHGKDMEGIYCEVCSEKDYIKEYKGIPSWCPLKPMPKKRDYSEELADTRGFDMYMEGWNDCIDAITGETE